MRFVIYGYYGARNVGDELILMQIVHELRNRHPGADVRVVSIDPDYTLRTHGLPAINRFSPSQVAESVARADAVIVGGGGLIQEHHPIEAEHLFDSFGYGIQSYATVPLIARMLGKPVFYWSQGVGPLFSEKAIAFARWFFSLADYITVRDPYSYWLLQTLNPALVGRTTLDCDPIFALDIERLIRPLTIPLTGERVRVGVQLRPWNASERFVERLTIFLGDYHRRRPGVQYVLIPFDLRLDHAELDKLRHRLPDDACLDYPWRYLATPGEVVSYMAAARLDCLIAMRFHAVLVAYHLRIPTLALSYDIKTDELAKQLGFSGLPAYDRAGLIDLEKRLDNFLNAPPQVVAGDFLHETPALFERWLDAGGIIRRVADPARPQIELQEDPMRIAQLTQEVNHLRAQLLDQKRMYTRELAVLRHVREANQAYEDFCRDVDLDHLKGLARRLEALRLSLSYRLLRVVLACARHPLRAPYQLARSLWRRLRAGSDQPPVDALADGDLLLDVHQQVAGMLAEDQTVWHRVQLGQALSRHADKPVIYLPTFTSWRVPLYQRPQHLATQLARQGFLYFFGTRNMWGDRVEGFEQIVEGCYLTSCPELVERLDCRMAIHLYSTDLKRNYADIERLREKGHIIIYDYIDEIDPSVSGTIPEGALDKHRKLLEDESVYVLCTARSLYQEVRAVRRRNFALVTNGVEVEHFTHEFTRDQIPAPMREIVGREKPIIGYYGALAQWFDYELVLKLAKARPDLEIVLIGMRYDKSLAVYEQSFADCSNLNYLEPVDYQELPAYAYWFDVATIPFKVNSVTHSTSPLKLFEYMALRRPIVTTAMAEMHHYERNILVGRNHEEFIAMVDQALTLRNDQDYLQQLLYCAHENSWEHKARIIAELIAPAFREIENEAII
jgi:polysaccharide pyruvyl transferase CsaB